MAAHLPRGRSNCLTRDAVSSQWIISQHGLSGAAEYARWAEQLHGFRLANSDLTVLIRGTCQRSIYDGCYNSLFLIPDTVENFGQNIRVVSCGGHGWPSRHSKSCRQQVQN